MRLLSLEIESVTWVKTEDEVFLRSTLSEKYQSIWYPSSNG